MPVSNGKCWNAARGRQEEIPHECWQDHEAGPADQRSGKDHADYQAIVGTMSMHPDDMKEIGIPSGSTVRVRSDLGGGHLQMR